MPPATAEPVDARRRALYVVLLVAYRLAVLLLLEARAGGPGLPGGRSNGAQAGPGVMDAASAAAGRRAPPVLPYVDGHSRIDNLDEDIHQDLMHCATQGPGARAGSDSAEDLLSLYSCSSLAITATRCPNPETPSSGRTR